MSINLDTSDPSKLLTEFKAAIAAKKIVTWSVDSDGDFIHTPEQWKNLGWLRPHIRQGSLVMTFIGRQTPPSTREVFAVYQGRFIESMIVHCSKLFNKATATADPTAEDSKVA